MRAVTSTPGMVLALAINNETDDGLAPEPPILKIAPFKFPMNSDETPSVPSSHRYRPKFLDKTCPILKSRQHDVLCV